MVFSLGYNAVHQAVTSPNRRWNVPKCMPTAVMAFVLQNAGDGLTDTPGEDRSGDIQVYGKAAACSVSRGVNPSTLKHRDSTTGVRLSEICQLQKNILDEST